MNQRILIVEDDPSIARLLIDNLLYEGFSVEWAEAGDEALRLAEQRTPDLILLDLMLPGMDGFGICAALAQRPQRIPVIILTAKGQQEDKVRGLNLGADDYVTKPFALDELLARMRAVLRRSQPAHDRLVLGDVVIDFRLKRGWSQKRELRLTYKELDLLEYLAQHEGQVVTRDELLRAVWRYHDIGLTRVVDSFIARLRRKIEQDPHHPRFIRTVHGDGYSLTVDPRGAVSS